MTYTKDTISFVPKPTHWRFQDLTGRVFTRLSILGYAGKRSSSTRHSHWFYQCKCGKIGIVDGVQLNNGHTRSCGCLSRDRVVERSTTHGESHTPAYKAYKGAKGRCDNPNDAVFAYYGGRGIEFRFECFEDFLIEIGHKPSPKHSLDRFPDNNGHYEKGNIKWSTKREQACNRRSTRMLTLYGVTKSMSEWSDYTTIQYAGIHARLALGWCDECAVFQPLHGHCVHR